jgi:hypothetical protein
MGRALRRLTHEVTSMSNQTRQSQLFNHILLQAIDDVLTSIGGATKNIIYLCLRDNKGISREQIPQRITEFHETLESVIGAKGGMLVEDRILQLLEARAGVKCSVGLREASVVECIVFLYQQFVCSERLISDHI